MWSLLVAVVLASGPGVKEEATRAFRRGDLARASKLFAQVVEAQPRDASGWADLGLCLAKQGKRREAVDALDRAISLGDPVTRSHAYYNLGKFELRQVALADLDLASGVDWPAPAGCDQGWSLRAGSQQDCGSSICTTSHGYWVGPWDRVQAQSPGKGSFDILLQERSQAQFCERDCQRYSRCDPCLGWALPELSGPDPAAELAKGVLGALLPKVQACVSRQKRACLQAPVAPDCRQDWDACLDEVCEVFERAEDKDLPPAQRAFKEAVSKCQDKCEHDCEASNAEEERKPDPLAGCALVSVNPCAWALGLVCTDPSGALRAEEETVPPQRDGG